MKRAESARLTRRRILASARELLATDGYAAMTIASLARHAKVSPQTVYNSIGGKAEVVKALWDVSIAGDDEPVPMSERPEFLALRAATELETWAVAYANWSAHLGSRVAHLVYALQSHGSAGDPVLENLFATTDKERRIGNTASLNGLVAAGTLPEAALSRAVDGVWVLSSPTMYVQMVIRNGWTHEDFAAWLAVQLQSAVLFAIEHTS